MTRRLDSAIADDRGRIDPAMLGPLVLVATTVAMLAGAVAISLGVISL